MENNNESIVQKSNKIWARHEGGKAGEGSLTQEEVKSAYKESPKDFIMGAKSTHWSAN